MTSRKPNIVLIFVDNQPAKMLGCAGNTEVHTPNLDALAGRGTRFTEAYCPNAMCSPCRASVLTGRMPSQHGIHTWLDDSNIANWPEEWNAIGEFEALPKRLAGAGYDTALVGKYHLGKVDKPQNGFREWSTLQIGHVLSFYDNRMVVNDEVIEHPGHSVEFFTDRAVKYIDERSQTPDDPFFMFLTYPAPYGHWPSIKGEPTNEFAHVYRDTPFNSVPREGISGKLMDWILVRSEKHPYHLEVYKQLAQIPNDLPTLRNYYSQMSMVDKGVGEVISALDRNGIADDTLIIYTSDHGMSLGEHGFWGHGEDTWPSNTHREAHNIPLIVKPPHSEGGVAPEVQVRDAFVGTTDIFSTVLDYAGLPADPESPSRSMRSLLENSGDSWEDVVFMEQEETRSIRTSKWLLMTRVGNTEYDFADELYDLVNDPDERKNVADDPDHAEIRATLRAQLAEFFGTYSDPKWNLWEGGTVKSNSTRPFLWRELWGEAWEPTH